MYIQIEKFKFDSYHVLQMLFPLHISPFHFSRIYQRVCWTYVHSIKKKIIEFNNAFTHTMSNILNKAQNK